MKKILNMRREKMHNVGYAYVSKRKRNKRMHLSFIMSPTNTRLNSVGGNN